MSKYKLSEWIKACEDSDLGLPNWKTRDYCGDGDDLIAEFHNLSINVIFKFDYPSNPDGVIIRNCKENKVKIYNPGDLLFVLNAMAPYKKRIIND